MRICSMGGSEYRACHGVTNLVLWAKENGEEQTSVIQSISSSRRWVEGIVHFIGTMARESTMDKMSAPKKKLRGFPHVFYIWKF
jgi:hypothetical protein